MLEKLTKRFNSSSQFRNLTKQYDFSKTHSRFRDYLRLYFSNRLFFLKTLNHRSIISHLNALYAQSLGITLAPLVLPRLLARVQTGLFLKFVSLSFLNSEVYDHLSLLPSCNIAWSNLRSLPNILDCCWFIPFGPYFSPNVAVHPLRSAKDLWLGKPLPYQQPNLAKAHLIAAFRFKIAF